MTDYESGKEVCYENPRSNKWQFINVFVYSFAMLFGGGAYLFNDLCLPPIRYKCEISDHNGVHNMSIDQCDFFVTKNISTNISVEVSQSCKKFKYVANDVFETSARSTFDLVCGRQRLVELDLFMFLAGGFVSCIVVSYFADNVGRKKALIVSMLLAISCELTLVFSPYYTIFLIARFIDGFAGVGVYHACFTACNEIVSPKFRNFIGLIIYFFFGGSLIFASLVSWLTRKWIPYVVIIALMNAIPLICVIFIASESPRWLYLHRKCKNEKKEAKKVEKNEKLILEENQVNEKPSSLFDFVLHQNMLGSMLTLTTCAIASNFLYYGVLFSASLFHVKKHIYLVFMGAVEMPGALVYLLLSYYLSRRSVHFLSFVLGGSFCIIGAFLPKEGMWMIFVYAAAICGRLFATSAMINTYMWSSEIVPTSHRAIGVGIIVGIGRLSSVTIPGLRILSDLLWSSISPLCIGILGVSCGFLFRFLRETKDMHLLDTFQEYEIQLKYESKEIET